MSTIRTSSAPSTGRTRARVPGVRLHDPIRGLPTPTVPGGLIMKKMVDGAGSPPTCSRRTTVLLLIAGAGGDLQEG